MKRVLLSDGQEATLRPIEPSDRDAFLAFHRGLSEEARYLRYFSARRELPESEIRHYMEVDQRDHAGIVATLGDELIGHALYDRLDGTNDAEAALEVADAFQGHGVGTLMLEALAQMARRAGIDRFVAHVLPINRTMLEVFRGLGFEEHAAFDDGVVRVEMNLAATPRFEASKRAREEHAKRRRPRKS